MFLITMTDLFKHANTPQTIWWLLSERSGERHSNRIPIRGELASVDSGLYPESRWGTFRDWVTGENWALVKHTLPSAEGWPGTVPPLMECNCTKKKKKSLQMFLPSLKRKNMILAPGWDKPCVCLQLAARAGEGSMNALGLLVPALLHVTYRSRDWMWECLFGPSHLWWIYLLSYFLEKSC